MTVLPPGGMCLRQTLPHRRLQLSPACKNFACWYSLSLRWQKVIVHVVFTQFDHALLGRSKRAHQTLRSVTGNFSVRTYSCTHPSLFSLFVSLAACGARGGFGVSRTFPGPIPRPDVSYWASGQPSACGAEVAWGRMLISLTSQVPNRYFRRK